MDAAQAAELATKRAKAAVEKRLESMHFKPGDPVWRHVGGNAMAGVSGALQLLGFGLKEQGIDILKLARGTSDTALELPVVIEDIAALLNRQCGNRVEPDPETLKQFLAGTDYPNGQEFIDKGILASVKSTAAFEAMESLRENGIIAGVTR